MTLGATGLASIASALADDHNDPVKELGTVTVIGTRPTSLPTQIPTTIEGTTAAEIEDRINATDSEDALKYFPSLLVRKRFVGDYDHAVLATRASGTGNSARSLVYADGILISNLLGNGATFTPRWGLVTPEEIARVDVLYGPFSAAYPGNSVGAVVDYITKMPTEFTANVRINAFGQDYDLYRTHDEFSGRTVSGSIGDRHGDFSWWVNLERLDNSSQPIVFANRLLSAGTPSTVGTPVTGAITGLNPKNQPWLILGTTNQVDTTQDHAKLKLAYDLTPTLRASYTLGAWTNSVKRHSDSFLRDQSGTPIYSGDINVDGRRYTLTATDFSPARSDLRHVMQGLTIKSATAGAWDWEVAASLYDYGKDIARAPTVALPAASIGGTGRITDMSGTGWNTLALKGVWRPGGDDGRHLIDLGVERDRYVLATLVSNTNDWIDGSAGGRFSAFGGNTELESVYAQDTWTFASRWRSTLGARVERWEASNGYIANAATRLPFASRTETYVSPKGALAYQLTDAWTLKASVGRAVRMPTVSELYQGTISVDTIVNNDPNLLPERSWTGELTAERRLDLGSLRMTFFHEKTEDALYSQTNVTAIPNVTNIQNVDRIRTSGIELAYQASAVFVEGLDVASSVTYADSKIVDNRNFPASVGKWQPRVPDWRANLLVSYSLRERWMLTLGSRYSGKQYNTLDNSDPNGFAYTGVSPFLVTDARVRYRINELCTASLGIDNLTNEKYWNFHPYPQRTAMGEVAFTF
jgi:iron complex outermembrane receptor protein